MKIARVMAVVAGGLGLAACSFAMPSMDFFSSKPTTASLSIESNPPGADARLSTGGTCRTPCAVTVPLASEFSVTVALDGYTPETQDGEPVSAEASAGSPGATALLDPNPLFVELKPTAAAKAAAAEEEAQAPDPGGLARAGRRTHGAGARSSGACARRLRPGVRTGAVTRRLKADAR